MTPHAIMFSQSLQWGTNPIDPFMTPLEFQTVYPHVIGWMRQTLADHAGEAKRVASQGFKRLPLCFSGGVLKTTKFVAVERVPVPPLSAFGLNKFAAFENGHYDGITFFDTYFVRRHWAADESLHFHELIHVVQWRLLGPECFLALYAAGLESHGYRNGPLEVMAYDAQAAFDQDIPPFDAEKLVAENLKQLKAP
jgi:hypothetical protein